MTDILSVAIGAPPRATHTAHTSVFPARLAGGCAEAAAVADGAERAAAVAGAQASARDAGRWGAASRACPR